MPRTNAGPSAFLDPAAPTLARVLDRLAVVEPDPRRRGEMASAVRTLGRVLGRLPHELPADTALLNRLMRAALPASRPSPPAASTGAGLGGARHAPARSFRANDPVPADALVLGRGLDT